MIEGDDPLDAWYTRGGRRIERGDGATVDRRARDHGDTMIVLIDGDDRHPAPDIGALRHGVRSDRLVDIALWGDHRERVGRIQVREVDAGAAEDRDARRLVRPRV